MTYAAPTFDFYDDGLVHSHDWSRNTPPGSHHADSRRAPQSTRNVRTTRDDDAAAHDHR
jgi:hypothetical protein